MQATLFFYGPFRQTLDLGGAAMLCGAFGTIVQARNWAVANGVRCYDARFKRVEQIEAGLVWQVVSRRSRVNVLRERLACDYVGISLNEEKTRDERARETVREILGGRHEVENWKAPFKPARHGGLHAHKKRVCNLESNRLLAANRGTRAR